MHVVLCLKRLMTVPISNSFAHGVGAVEQLNEAYAALDQAPGKDAIFRKARLRSDWRHPRRRG